MEVEENRTEEQNLNFADDTGELDYEPSEPDNSIKDAASVEDENESFRSSPRHADDDLEEGEVDEMEDGEVKEDDDDDAVCSENDKIRPSVTTKLTATDPQNVKRVSEMLHTGDVRPEDVGICKFYIRGQCTWGNFCKFLHPGVNERGSYQMQYDSHPAKLMSKPAQPPAPPPQPPRIAPPPVKVAAPPAVAAESAWERGVKQAREMMKKANEKKENDVDFEEKRVNMPSDSVKADEREGSPARRSYPLRSSDSSYYGRFAESEPSPPPQQRPLPLMQQRSLMDDFRGSPDDEMVQQRLGYVERGDRSRIPQQQQQQYYRRRPQQTQPQQNRYFQNKAADNGDRQPEERSYGYERRRNNYVRDKGRPLPYERPSYEAKEWRDPWMRSAKTKPQPGEDYPLPERANEKSADYRRKRSFSGSSSVTRSSGSSKSSATGSSPSTSPSRSVSTIGSGSSSRGSKGGGFKNKRSRKTPKNEDGTNREEKSQPPKSYSNAVRSISPISRDSDSPLESIEKGNEQIPADVEPPPRKETNQRKPIKMTILNKSKVQVPLAYEDEVNTSQKLEPSSPVLSSPGAAESPPGKRKLAPADFEDISPQESDEEDPSEEKEKKESETVSSRREELLKQLKAVEEAIAKKRTTKTGN